MSATLSSSELSGQSDQTDLLIEQIYEATHCPELWPAVLEQIGRIIDAPFGFVIIGDPDAARWANTPAFDEKTARLVRERWLTRGAYPRKLSQICAPRFIADQEVMTLEELRGEPLFSDFCFPSDLGFGATTGLELPTGERVTIGWRRRFGAEPLGLDELKRLDSLRLALIRAVWIGARSRQRGMATVVDTLAAVGMPALILDGDRHVLAANGLLETIKLDVAWSGGGFALRDPAADASLRDALERMKSGDTGAVTTFPVKVKSGRGYVARLLPLRSHDSFAREAAALVLASAGARCAPPEALLRSLFGLTPCEARVARALASGKSVSEIAANESVSPGTVRTHVRGVLEKTGSNRQIDAVALLVGMPLSLG
ncbi:helix-turn-helix transcriptional regulator [Methylocystis bryophila]|nr:helix-turn-helix transcriptional regulator [Methylocystis bryophila]BDV40866.1 LuxR family transcriptional regulator [Methylocystis bryophila]